MSPLLGLDLANPASLRVIEASEEGDGLIRQGEPDGLVVALGVATQGDQVFHKLWLHKDYTHILIESYNLGIGKFILL